MRGLFGAGVVASDEVGVSSAPPMRTILAVSTGWLLALGGCDSEPSAPAQDAGIDAAVGLDAPDAAPLVYPMPEAANAVPPSDPRWEGQYRWLYDAYRAEQLDHWPPADFMLSLMTSEPEVFGNQYASFGFIRDPNDEFPVGFKRGRVDRTRVNETCAVCHTARLPDGRVWFGAPATQLQLQRFIVEVDRRWVAAGHATHLQPGEETGLLRQGPGRIDATLGDSTNIPVDFPTYYSLARRPYLNVLGTSRELRSEAYLAVYSLGPGNPDDMTARIPFPDDEVLEPFVAFLGALEPPPPPAVDATMAARGRALFQSVHCDGCHHDDFTQNGVTPYQEGPERYPGQDAQHPRGAIHTDPLHYGLQSSATPEGDAGFDPKLLRYIQFIFRHHLQVGMTDGYRVTDLRGLAHTAPYLHNGSVPTLEDLLRPAAMRPRTFMRGTFTVDTAQPGNSNQGHEFGTELTEADRAALVVYLQSL